MKTPVRATANNAVARSTHLVDTLATTLGNTLQSRSFGATQAAQRLSL
jgi:hypothetical protein